MLTNRDILNIMSLREGQGRTLRGFLPYGNLGRGAERAKKIVKTGFIVLDF